MMQDNAAVADWARQNIPNPINVKVRFNSLPVQIFLIAVFVFFVILLMALPTLLASVAVRDAFAKGWSGEITGRLGCSGVLFVVFGAMLAIPFSYFRKMRGEIVRTFTSEGVETRSRRKYGWESLAYINLVSAKRKFKKVPNSFEIVFTNGKAIVPPLIENQAAIVGIVNSIPAERRSELR